MSPFKPLTGLPHQALNSAIPALGENSQDRNSALEREPYQPILKIPNPPNNKRPANGAFQTHFQKPPKSKKVGEQRGDRAHGQRIATGVNNLTETAPWDASENFSRLIDDSNSQSIDLSALQDELLADQGSANFAAALSQGSFSLDLLDNVNFGSEGALLNNQASKIGLANTPNELLSDQLADRSTLDLWESEPDFIFLTNSSNPIIMGTSMNGLTETAPWDASENFSRLIDDSNSQSIDLSALQDELLADQGSANFAAALSQGSFPLDLLDNVNFGDKNTLLENQPSEIDLTSAPKKLLSNPPVGFYNLNLQKINAFLFFQPMHQAHQIPQVKKVFH